jgi:hypothetical protein
METIGLEGVFRTEAFASGLSKYTSGLASAVSKTASAGGALGNAIGGAIKVGITAFAGLSVAAVAAAAAVGGAITKMVFDAATMADTYSQLSGVTGISTTRLQELKYAGTMLDVDLETMTSSLRFLTRNMYAARDGTGEQADAFKALGIRIFDVKGKLRDADTVWGETLDALGKVKNATEADAIAMKLMGRSAMDLNPLKGKTADIKAFSQEAHDMGAVVSEEGIAALDEFKDRMDGLKLSIKGIAAGIALNFLPAFQDMQDLFGGNILAISEAMASGDWGMVADNTAEILAQVMDKIKAFIPRLAKKTIEIVKWIVQVIKAKLPYFIKSGIEIIAALAKGFGNTFPTLVTAAGEIVQTLGKALQDNWPKILQAGKDILNGLGDGLKAGWALLKPNLPSGADILDWIFKTGVNLSGKLLEWVQGIDWGGLSDTIADFIGAIPWETYGPKFRTALENVGKAILTAFNGIRWGELGISVGTGFVDFVASAIKPGASAGTIQAEWANIGEQWGKTVAAGMGPTFWKVYWADLFNYAFGLSWTDAMNGLKVNFDQVGQNFRTWWQNLGTNMVTWLATYIRDPIVQSFTNMINEFITLINGMIIRLNEWNIGGATGALIPFMATPQSAAPSVPVPNVYGPGSQTGGIGPGASHNTTNNITVNNPAAEPASNSIDRALLRMSYLGIT